MKNGEGEESRRDIGIVKTLEGTSLRNKKTGDQNVKLQRREGAERPFTKQMNGAPQGKSTQRMGLPCVKVSELR
jgi:hypothetical protein